MPPLSHNLKDYFYLGPARCVACFPLKFKPLKYTKMKQSNRDFLKAIGFEGNEKDMLKQLAFGFGVGIVLILALGLAELIGEWIGG